MKSTLVKTPPSADFIAISALTHDWRGKFQALVRQRQPILYDFYPLPQMPEDLRMDLEVSGYVEQVLEKDQWQRFLLPGN